jgi:sulfur carrier protein
MKLTVNGDEIDMHDRATVTDVLARLGIGQKGIAVAVDWAVVPRSRWDTELSDGALVEVVTAVQGG